MKTRISSKAAQLVWRELDPSTVDRAAKYISNLKPWAKGWRIIIYIYSEAIRRFNFSWVVFVSLFALSVDRYYILTALILTLYFDIAYTKLAPDINMGKENLIKHILEGKPISGKAVTSSKRTMILYIIFVSSMVYLYLAMTIDASLFNLTSAAEQRTRYHGALGCLNYAPILFGIVVTSILLTRFSPFSFPFKGEKFSREKQILFWRGYYGYSGAMHVLNNFIAITFLSVSSVTFRIRECDFEDRYLLIGFLFSCVLIAAHTLKARLAFFGSMIAGDIDDFLSSHQKHEGNKND